MKGTHYEEMMNRLGGADEGHRRVIRDELISAVIGLREDPDAKFVYDRYNDLNGGGEFQSDAAIMAMVNGWTRDEKGRLPFGLKIKGKQWFETVRKNSSQRIARILESAVIELRDRRKKEADEDKRKREIRKYLKSRGYKKMWVKIETGHLGSTSVDIFDGKLYLKVEGVLIEMRKA